MNLQKPILFEETPVMPQSLVKELRTIQEALVKIDFQLNHEDKPEFYTYVMNELYDAKGDYANPDFAPKKYYEVLLKEIKKAINWNPDFSEPL